MKNVTEVLGPDLADPNSEFLLALAVLGNRIRALKKEDREDLCELLPYLYGDDPEEREGALTTLREILAQPSGTLKPMALSENLEGEHQAWIEHISARLKAARKKAKLTQEQLADKSGIPQSHISRLEAGQHSPSAKTLEKLAAALGIEAREFDSAF